MKELKIDGQSGPGPGLAGTKFFSRRDRDQKVFLTGTETKKGWSRSCLVETRQLTTLDNKYKHEELLHLKGYWVVLFNQKQKYYSRRIFYSQLPSSPACRWHWTFFFMCWKTFNTHLNSFFLLRSFKINFWHFMSLNVIIYKMNTLPLNI